MARFLTFVYFFGFMGGVISENDPFVDTPRRQEAFEGDDVKFVWKAGSEIKITETVVFWNPRNLKILAISFRKMIKKAAYEQRWSVDIDLTTIVLKLRNVTLSDTGTYLCSFRGRILNDTYLEVRARHKYPTSGLHGVELYTPRRTSHRQVDHTIETRTFSEVQASSVLDVEVNEEATSVIRHDTLPLVLGISIACGFASMCIVILAIGCKVVKSTRNLSRRILYSRTQAMTMVPRRVESTADSDYLEPTGLQENRNETETSADSNSADSNSPQDDPIYDQISDSDVPICPDIYIHMPPASAAILSAVKKHIYYNVPSDVRLDDRNEISVPLHTIIDSDSSSSQAEMIVCEKYASKNDEVVCPGKDLPQPGFSRTLAPIAETDIYYNDPRV